MRAVVVSEPARMDEKRELLGGGHDAEMDRGDACKPSCLPSAQRLLEMQGDSKCKWMNPNGHKDKERRLGRRREQQNISGNSPWMVIQEQANLHFINVWIYMLIIYAVFKCFFRLVQYS